MTTETMTVHQALCELKTLDARIVKAMSESFVFANKHSNTKVSGQDISDFCEQIKSNYQSVTDLIARRDAIKRAVVNSNAVTTVVIGGKTYTVAEAIDMKNNGIPARQRLLSRITSSWDDANRVAMRSNGADLEDRADAYIKSLFGNSDMKGVTEDVKKMRADFITAQTVEIVDPINAKDEMKRLEKEINDFVVEIDSSLSVSNALTKIEISY
jgi:hypothetical protein